MLLRSPPGISMQLEKFQPKYFHFKGQAGQTMYPHNESTLRYFANNHQQYIILGDLSLKVNNPIIPDDMSSILINSDNYFKTFNKYNFINENQMILLSKSKGMSTKSMTNITIQLIKMQINYFNHGRNYNPSPLKNQIRESP